MLPCFHPHIPPSLERSNLRRSRKHFSPTEPASPPSGNPSGYSEPQSPLHPSGTFASHSSTGQGPALGQTLLRETRRGLGEASGPGRALFPDPGGGYTADMSAFRELKTADLHTSLEGIAPGSKQTWFYFNKVIQPLLVVPKLAILRFLQTTEISF